MTELDLDAIAKAYGKHCLDLPGSTPLTVVRVFQQVPHLIDEIRRLQAQIEQTDREEEPDIDAYDIMKLRHMLGIKPHIPEPEWGYRNYYVAVGNNSIAAMERLCNAGFVKHDGGYYYRATRKGVELVGLTGKQLERVLGEEND